MKHRLCCLLLLAAILCSPLAQAQIVVLVHGYAADGRSWTDSGVQAVLAAHGWLPGGGIADGPLGPRLSLPPLPSGTDRTISVNLPSAAPINVQAAHLRAAIDLLQQRYPDESLILVGHSAGGVVARLAILGRPPGRIAALITIASPHLGTERALQGLEAVNDRPFFCPGPGFEMLKRMIGGSGYEYLQVSQPLLWDLAPVETGNMLGWLNVQPHPAIDYISIVRAAPGDAWVPAFSQDMNNVPALHGRARTYVEGQGHGLQPGDGALLARILADLEEAAGRP